MAETKRGKEMGSVWVNAGGEVRREDGTDDGELICKMLGKGDGMASDSDCIVDALCVSNETGYWPSSILKQLRLLRAKHKPYLELKVSAERLIGVLRKMVGENAKDKSSIEGDVAETRTAEHLEAGVADLFAAVNQCEVR